MKKLISFLFVAILASSLYAVPPKRANRNKSHRTTTVKPKQPKLDVVADTIDLGLGVYWASWNIGASKPEMMGAEFAWGEISTNPNANKKTYKFYNPESYAYTKYYWYGEDETDFDHHRFDSNNNILLDSIDDAAVVNWGNGWRMPTYQEAHELYKQCKWKWLEDSESNIYGYRVTGPNGNSIFLPGKDIGDVSFWTSASKIDKYPNRGDGNESAWGLIMNHFNAFLFDHYRYATLYIRPVKDKK